MTNRPEVPDDARSGILKRIRSIRASAPAHGSPHAHERSSWDGPSRTYRQHGLLSSEARLDLLEERLRDYDAEVTRVRSRDVAEVAGDILRRRESRSSLLPAGFPRVWRPQDVDLTEDDGLSLRGLDHFDNVVVTVSLAIAQTGTLVLQSGPGEGRRALTLIPDFCLCVVWSSDVVETVPEAFARLEEAKTRPITFLSGPSATADIEMTRIKGVHGPRFLHVLVIVDDEQTDSM